MSRTLDPTLWRDDFFASLSMFERLVWIGLLITVADDQGRFLGNPLLIRADLFPMDNIEPVEISDALSKFCQAEKLYSYLSGGKFLFQIVNWWKYQKASAWMSLSRYPAPDNWIDRARFHGPQNVIAEQNWKQPGGFNGHISQAQPIPTKPTDWQPETPEVPSPLPSALSSREGEVKGEGKGKGEGKRGARTLPNELELYRRVTKSLPTKPQFDFVTAYIRENQITETALQDAWTLWTARGYNPRNVKGILEFAKSGRSIQGGENSVKTSVTVATRSFDKNAENLKIAIQEAANA